MERQNPTKHELLARRPRTRRALEPADMERLYALYYDAAVPVSQVARAFDLPVSTLLRWIDEMDWPKRRAGALAAVARAAPDRLAAPEVTADSGVLAKSLMEAAASELEAIKEEPLGVTLEERERRARLIASLSASLQRIDRSLLKAAEMEGLRRRAAAIRATDPRWKEIRAVEADIKTYAIDAIRREFERARRKLRS